MREDCSYLRVGGYCDTELNSVRIDLSNTTGQTPGDHQLMTLLAWVLRRYGTLRVIFFEMVDAARAGVV